MKKRIWELDAFRGICVLGMVMVHFIYDLTELYGIWDWKAPDWFSFLQNWGGVLFLLISGISATLGRRSVKRGLVVLGAGLIVTAVTYGMYRFGFDKGIIIYFGVLHCLGLCMVSWWLFKRLPSWALLLIAIPIIAAGLQVGTMVFPKNSWLVPLGFVYPGFVSSDYFPLLPNLGFFLAGAVLGRIVYREKTTLLPKVRESNPIVRVLTFCGRQSLLIYLLHQPVLSGICMLLH